jgi:hypothetical protein
MVSDGRDGDESRRGFLKCMTWAGTGLVWTLAGGVPASIGLQAAAIPEPFREALVLRDLEDLSYREVAEVTGVPMGTVMSRLARARRVLAERMGVLEAST